MPEATIQQQIREQLAELYDDDGAQAWLHASQRLLDHEIPAQLIARGEGKRVRDLLQAILDGAYL